MKKPSGIYVVSHRDSEWEKKLPTVKKVVAKDSGGARFVILSIERSSGCKQSWWVEGVGRCTYTIFHNRVTYVVLPKTKAREALQKIIDEYTQQKVRDIAALFLPAMKAVEVK